MQNLFEKYRQIVVFDIETTGFSPIDNDTIEFAAVVLKAEGETFRVMNTENVFVKPRGPIPQKITDLTNITDEMIRNDSVSPQHLSTIIEDLFTKDSLIVAYNIQFDIGFVYEVMKRHNPSFQFTADVLDLLTVYRAFHQYPHRLENAIETYAIKIPNSHRAIDDTMATAELLKCMHRDKTITPYINRVDYYKKYGLKGVRFDHITYMPR